MNWTVDQNGAYDYGAETRQVDFGGVLEYQSPKWAPPHQALLSTVANGPDLQVEFA